MNKKIFKFNPITITHSDCNIGIAISDDGYCDYSVMTLVECGNQKRLFNRLLIEDWKGGEIHAY